MATPSHRRIIIGDVHGHYDGLVALLDQVAPGGDDQVYFLGDLIDRGPRSADVIDLVRFHHFHCLLGNHEQMLLQSFPKAGHSNSLQSWLHSGGNNTIASYRDWDQLLEHLEWVRELPLYKDLGDAWLVHAGLNPHVPLSMQTANELCWIREEFHSIHEPYFLNKLVITGHTITFTLPGVAPGELAQGQGWLDIDTGAYHPRSGWLTAVDIDQWKVYQVNVFDLKQQRVLPFDEVVTKVNPNKVKSGLPRLTPQH